MRARYLLLQGQFRPVTPENTMANTNIPSSGSGDIIHNGASDADGAYKLKDSTSGDGHLLWFQGSHAASGDNNGGNVRIQGGDSSGTGIQGSVEIVGGMQISRGYNYPSIVIVPPPTGDATTDTHNINHAIELVAHNSSPGSYSMGGIVMLHQGTYAIGYTGTIHSQYYGVLMKNGITLQGVGQAETGTVLEPATSGLAIIMWDTLSAPNISRVCDLRIQNNPESSNITGIFAGSLEPPYNPGATAPEPTLERVYIQGVNIGIQVTAWKASIVDCSVINCQDGIRMEYPWYDGYDQLHYDSTNTVTMDRCYVSGCMNYGVYVRGNVNTITHSVIRTPDYGTGIYLESGSLSNHIVDNYMEVTANPSYYATGLNVGSIGNTVTGNYFDMGGGTRWIFADLTANTLIGNTESVRVEGSPVTYPYTFLPNQLTTLGVRYVVTSSNHPAGEESFIGVNSDGAVKTVTLPDASKVPGRIYYIKELSDTPAGITIDPYGTQTIEDQPTLSFQGKYCYQIISIGTEWRVIGQAFLARGSGSPESVVTAGPGSLYLNSSGGSGTSLYVKQSGSGNTGWAGK